MTSLSGVVTSNVTVPPALTVSTWSIRGGAKSVERDRSTLPAMRVNSRWTPRSSGSDGLEMNWPAARFSRTCRPSGAAKSCTRCSVAGNATSSGPVSGSCAARSIVGRDRTGLTSVTSVDASAVMSAPWTTAPSVGVTSRSVRGWIGRKWVAIGSRPSAVQ